MNLFALDLDPVTAARMHCDRHVVKMPLETAQMLSTAMHDHAPAWHESLVRAGLAYRVTHARHPCTLWVGETRANARWALELGLELVREHGRRYAHTKAGQRGHAAGPVLRALAPLLEALPDTPSTPFAQAMPTQYRGADAVAAYRAYYLGEKARFATWRTPASPPAWWAPTRLTTGATA